MRITAHSLVPSNPQLYMHLGYTSAAPQINAIGPVFLAFIFLSIAALTFKKSQIAAFVSVLLMAGTCFYGGIRYHQGVQTVVEGQTRRMGSILPSIVEEATSGKNRMNVISQNGIPLEIHYRDNWGHPYRLAGRVYDDGRTIYTLISSGPDGIAHTEDDIAVTQTVVVVDTDSKKPPQSQPGNAADKR